MQFEVPGGNSVSWETCVNSITVYEGCNVRAIAGVTYQHGSDNSRNYYVEEKGIIHFMQGKIGLLFSSAGSLSNGSEASWKFMSELGSSDVLSNSGPKRTQKVNRKVPDTGKRHGGSAKKVKISKQERGHLPPQDQTKFDSKERSL